MHIQPNYHKIQSIFYLKRNGTAERKQQKGSQ